MSVKEEKKTNETFALNWLKTQWNAKHISLVNTMPVVVILFLYLE